MVHSGGVNRSADARWVPEGPQIRMVVPCDFQKEGLTYLESETSNPGPNHQWWVNTRQVRRSPRLHNCVAQIFCEPPPTSAPRAVCGGHAAHGREHVGELGDLTAPPGNAIRAFFFIGSLVR